jgi:hypothetical protein
LSAEDRRSIMAGLEDVEVYIDSPVIWLPSREVRINSMLYKASERLPAAGRVLALREGGRTAPPARPVEPALCHHPQAPQVRASGPYAECGPVWPSSAAAGDGH